MEFLHGNMIACLLIAVVVIIIILAVLLYLSLCEEIKSLRARRDWLAEQNLNEALSLQHLREQWRAQSAMLHERNSVRVRAILGQVYRMQHRLVAAQAVIDSLVPLANRAAQTTGEVIRVGYEVRLMAERGLKDHRIIPPQALREILALEAPFETMSGEIREHIDEFNDCYTEYMKSGGTYARILAGRLERQQQGAVEAVEKAKEIIGSGTLI